MSNDVEEVVGILKELFSKPIYGPNGEMGDVAVERAVPYSEESEREALANKRRGTVRQAQQRFVGRRAAMPPEEAALLLAQTLQQHGPLTRKVLGQKTRLFGPAFDAAAAHGKLQREDRPAHANGGGPSTQVWSLPPDEPGQYQRHGNPTNYADIEALNAMLASIPIQAWRGWRDPNTQPYFDMFPRLVAADFLQDLGRDDEAAILRDTRRHAYRHEGVIQDAFEILQAIRITAARPGHGPAADLPGDERQYLNTALWSTLNDEGYPLDEGATAHDISPGTLAAMLADYRHFKDTSEYNIGDQADDGHYFWLARNGHGTGFRDSGEWSPNQGRELDNHANKHGEYNLYLGDDGLIHGSYQVEDPLIDEQQYRRTTAGTSYHWMHAPPGGPHMLNGRPYRTGQFVPGTTMFTHTPRRPQDRQEAINPEAPLLYDPQYYGPSPMGPGGAQQQQDGTHALPMPANPGAPVQGAPQTVGGEPLAMPGQGAAQGPNDLPPPQSPGMAPGSPPGQQAPGIPQPVPQGPQPLRTPGLSPQDAVLEAQSQMFAWTNFGALRDAYFAQNAKLDPVSGDVRSLVLNSDQWNAYIPGFTGQNAGAVHQAAAWLNDQLFRESLQNQAGKGNNKMLIVSGAAAGEGTKDFLEASEYPLVLEQPSRDYSKVSDQFERARAAGMEPSFQYIDRPASENAAESIEQALQDRLAGRPAKTQPLEALARTNIDARRVALEVLFRNPDVETAVVDHHGGERFTRRMITDRGQAAMYLSRRMAEDERDMPAELEKTKQDLIRRQKAGEIPADLLTGWLGAGWHIRSPAPVQPRRWY